MITDDLESTLKWIITVAGVMSVLVKLFDSISDKRRKLVIKSDIELLEKLEAGNLDEEDRVRVEQERRKVVNEYLQLKSSPFKWFDVLYPIILFTGFGFCSIYIFEINGRFTPWIILTSLVSMIGLTLLLDNNWRNQNSSKAIYTIEIFSGVKYIFLCFGLTVAVALPVRASYEGYTHWYLLVATLVLFSIKGLADSIKISRTPR